MNKHIVVSITASRLIDLGLWDEVCELKGWNVWAVNEGLMDSDELVTFTIKECKKLGIPLNDY